MALIEKLTNIADAIREKTGGTEKLSLDGMAEAIAGISTGGGDEQSVLDSFIEEGLTEISSNTITKVRDYAFYYLKTLTAVNLPAVESAGKDAFRNCGSLTTLNLPALTSCGERAFSYNNLLTTVNLPALTIAGADTFAYCKGLTVATLPLLKHIVGNAFSNCSELTTVKIYEATSISSRVFYNCSKLNTIVIRQDDMVCSVASRDAFSGTPFAEGGTGGTVYVPATLIETYQKASNWAALYAAGTCNFVAIEGSEYE